MAHGSEEHCDGAGEYLFEVIDAAGCSIPWIGRRDSGGVRCSMTMYGGLCECEAAFVVPTAMFRVLFVFLILSHDRRRLVYYSVTQHPTSAWTAQQLLEAFPWDSAPRYLLHDRDGSYGNEFHQAAEWIGIHEVRTAPRSPWQNAYVERLIGSIRRECLDHVIVLRESGLRRILKSYFAYYERSRTHLSLAKDAPIPRAQQPPELGRVIELPEVGGLHHRYERRAA